MERPDYEKMSYEEIKAYARTIYERDRESLGQTPEGALEMVLHARAYQITGHYPREGEPYGFDDFQPRVDLRSEEDRRADQEAFYNNWIPPDADGDAPSLPRSILPMDW